MNGHVHAGCWWSRALWEVSRSDPLLKKNYETYRQVRRAKEELDEAQAKKDESMRVKKVMAIAKNSK